MKNTLLLVIAICFSKISFSEQEFKMTDKAIIKTATVNCSLDSMWWKWTTHEGLSTFFGEDNKIEFKTDGAFEIYFSKSAPEGQKGSEGCKVLSFIPKRLFSFSWNAPPSLMEARESGYHTCVVVEFKAISESVTEVTLTHSGWPDDKKWDAVYDYFIPAWGVVLDWLTNSCKTR